MMVRNAASTSARFGRSEIVRINLTRSSVRTFEIIEILPHPHCGRYVALYQEELTRYWMLAGTKGSYRQSFLRSRQFLQIGQFITDSTVRRDREDSWIIPTSVIRASPYWSKSLDELGDRWSAEEIGSRANRTGRINYAHTCWANSAKAGNGNLFL